MMIRQKVLVEVEPAHIHDIPALQPAIDDTAQRDCCPDELLCDTLYDSDGNVQEAQEKGVEVIAPIHGPAPKEGICLADFTCDPATQYVTHCPEGHDPQKTYRTKKNRLCATFPRETCLICSRRTDCPVQLGKKAAYLTMMPCCAMPNDALTNKHRSSGIRSDGDQASKEPILISNQIWEQRA